MLNDMNVAELQKTIGYTFEDKALLCRAFVHSSYANLKKQKSYERLEFLGDSLIGFVVADRLVADFPTKQEGDLTRMRQRLVEGKNLASLSRKLGFESCVSVIKNVAVSDDILEDVFEALVAAIYLDGGFEKAKTFVLNNFESQLDNMDEKVEKDFKSMVNEYYAKSSIEYKCDAESHIGADFEVRLCIDGQQVAVAKARNKESAEKLCAEQAISLIKTNNS